MRENTEKDLVKIGNKTFNRIKIEVEDLKLEEGQSAVVVADAEIEKVKSLRGGYQALKVKHEGRIKRLKMTSVLAAKLFEIGLLKGKTLEIVRNTNRQETNKESGEILDVHEYDVFWLREEQEKAKK